MKYLYAISLQMPTGGMRVINVVATKLADATAAAIKAAGLPEDTEPHTQQRLASVDLEA